MLETIETLLREGVSIPLLMNLIISVVALFVLLKVKDLITGYLSWTKFKGSTIVSFGTRVSVGTANGSKQGVVMSSSNRKRIAVDFGSTIRYYTPADFMSGAIEVVKSEV